MIQDVDKEGALDRVVDLVESFRQNEADYLSEGYNETQARTDFISPLLNALGWDVYNIRRQALRLREVIEEATVEVSEERLSKRPDYELRLARQRKLFVEAKKPSVRIGHDRASAFQVRRYGYSGSLPVSVLTNFHQLAVYDCAPVPAETDEAHVARLWLLNYDQFPEHFDELWEVLSRESIYSGEFDRKFGVDVTRRGAEQFDDLFLRQVRDWRERLAMDIHANCPKLSSQELTYVVQLFLCRIIFLRICEDREIEKYETLRNLNEGATFDALITELKRADRFYDSGIFRLLDDEPLGVRINDQTLQGIISELYYPQSPYIFSVVETEVLGQIYEQFLGEVIDFSSGSLEITTKPEVREGGGVVPTPQYIVDSIVEHTLMPSVRDKTPSDLEGFSVADICCGSGTFLLTAYEALMEHYLASYQGDADGGHAGRTIYETAGHHWKLTFEEKRRILLGHIRGVDIDANAVEVTRFSLLLKLIEDETVESLQDYVQTSGEPALPELEALIRPGNSLVSYGEWATAFGNLPATLIPNVNPLTWADEFPEEMGREGFDVIIGNPPYVRIQNMAIYSPEEVAFYQNPESPYSTGHQDNFDKYALFVERGLALLRPAGRLGFIVPHKFMAIRSGRTLRKLIAKEQVLEEIVHFGAKQVFGTGTSNYTSILVFDRSGRSLVKLELVGALEEWRYGKSGPFTEIPADEFGEDAWQFADEETRNLFARIREGCPSRLGDLAEIFVGVQTSADSIYIFEPTAENDETVTLHWNGRDWPIERDILRPCLLDVSLDPYSRPEANRWMIYPYELVLGGRGPRARLFQPEEMDSDFPGCWEYLNSRREELEQRNITGGRALERQWYQFGRSQSLTKFDGPKIILPILSLEARYSFDDSDVIVTGGGNGPYYMIRPRPESPVSNYFLLAVLHHPLSEAMVRTNTSVFRGGYYSHGKQFIEGIPIPVPVEDEMAIVDGLVADLINAIDVARAPGTPQERLVATRWTNHLKRVIEDRITHLFDLDANDMEVVRAVPSPY